MADCTANDREMHTIVLTPEQLAELGLQIQYPPLSIHTDTVPMQNVPRILSKPMMTNNLKMHKSIRLSNIQLNGNNFQLITDHLPNGSSTVDNTVLTDNDKIIIDDLGTISENLIPLNNISIINHGEIAPDINIPNVRSIQTIEGRLTKLDSTKRRVKINVKNKLITNGKHATMNPIMLKPQTVKKVVIQDSGITTGWNKGTSHQKVYVLQSGDTYHSVEKLDRDKLRVVSDAVNNIAARPENKNQVLFDPVAKTRIVYRVLNPEDLNLCKPNEPQDKGAFKKLLPKKGPKPKTSNQSDLPNPKVVSVTRSGRSVRPPRHKTNPSDKEDDSSMDVDCDPFNAESEEPPDKLKTRQRFICPCCKKMYNTSRRMARHLYTFPRHAIDRRCTELLEKYKLETQSKRPIAIDAESQTDFVTRVPEATQTVCQKKDAMTDGVNINTYREREDRSLFKSLIRILQRASAECRAYVFIRQLALLTVKLRKLLPCLLHRTKNSSACVINEPVGKILDLAPGKYHLDMDAIHCAKIQNGTCKHSQIPIVENVVPDDPSISFNDSWMNNKTEDCLEEKKPKSTRDKWPTPKVEKPKWIPIGSDNVSETPSSNERSWMPSNILTNPEPIKTWDTGLQNNGNTASDNSWISNIPKIDMTQNQNYECKDKLVGLHSDLVFKDMILKDDQNQSTENFDFNDSRFDMQLDSDKLNFTSAQYNEMKYGRDTLPPFRKIEPSKNLPLQVDGLNDINSNSNKLHIPSDDPILGGNNYPINTESLELSRISPLVDKDGNDGNMHCSSRELLESADLNLPISVSNALNRNESMLSVSESSLDGTRLSLSNSLNLLDPLGTDCLSFSDSELNPRTSQMTLDLQLDLFPFHHT